MSNLFKMAASMLYSRFGKFSRLWPVFRPCVKNNLRFRTQNERSPSFIQLRLISQFGTRYGSSNGTPLPPHSGKYIVGAFVCSGLCLSAYLYQGNRNSIIRDVLAETERKITPSERTLDGLHIVLYQYEACPFCTKVRTFLDYEKLPYDVVEVNPVMRKEIKFSKEYRKVPIMVITDTTTTSSIITDTDTDSYPSHTQVQLNDSSVIVSILKTYLIQEKNKSLEDILKFYPQITEKGKKSEFTNRHRVMFEDIPVTESELLSIREEVRWRQWTDDVLVHTLPPNIYRTPTEALQAFKYLTDISNFAPTEKIIGKYVGAFAMYFISLWLKRKYNLKKDVRESLYDAADEWCMVLKTRKFMGGDKPNLADLSVFGVLKSIEGLDTFHDLMSRTKIKQWYYRTKHVVGVNELRYNVDRGEQWTVTA